MKITTSIVRLLVGALFIFSGMIKLNDPQGFSYKLNEYFSVFAADVQADQATVYTDLQIGQTKLFADSFILNGYNSEHDLVLNISNKTKDSTIINDSIIVLKFLNKGLEVFNQPLKLKSAKDLSLSVNVGGKNLLNVIEKIDIQSSLNISKKLNYTSEVKKDSILVGFFNWLKRFTLLIAIFVCIFEVILGVNILIGWKPKWTAWLSLLMILFFTFLTFYSAYYNKVTDCGCFGDAIKLTPWESFSKDIILLVLVLWIFMRRNKIMLFFSKKLTHKILGLFFLLSIFIAGFSYFYTPPINFLHWKKGTNVNEAMRVPLGENAADLVEITYVYSHEGKEIDIVYNSENQKFTPTIPRGAKYLRIKEEKILKKGYKVPIHDFVVNHPEMGDIAGDILEKEGYKAMVLSSELKGFNQGSIPKLNKILSVLKEKNIPVWGITSTDLNDANTFTEKNKIPLKFNLAGRDVIRSMCRPNPTIMLMRDSIIIDIWDSRRIPNEKKISKILDNK